MLKHWRRPTKGEIAANAAEKDYEHLRAWCNDEWFYVSIGVRELSSGAEDYLGGMESDDDEGIAYYLEEFMDDINERLDNEQAETLEASRPDMYGE